MITKSALIKVIREIIRERGELSLREIARKSSIAPSAAKYIMDFLLSNSVVEKRILGKMHLFKIKNNFLTKNMKILYSLYEINSSKLTEEIIKRDNTVMSIILYGSVAKGEDDSKSDIDLLIISRKKLNIPDLKSENKLKRELNIIKYAYNEWKQKAQKDRVFYENIILNCIPLYGEKPVVI